MTSQKYFKKNRETSGLFEKRAKLVTTEGSRGINNTAERSDVSPRRLNDNKNRLYYVRRKQSRVFMTSSQDDNRFIEALTRHQAALEAFCHANLANREDAREVLQAT